MSLSPPIRLRQLAEAFAIEDGAGVVVAYLYFDDDPNRRSLTKRLTKTEAEEVAKVLAAALRLHVDANGGASR